MGISWGPGVADFDLGKGENTRRRNDRVPTNRFLKERLNCVLEMLYENYNSTSAPDSRCPINRCECLRRTQSGRPPPGARDAACPLHRPERGTAKDPSSFGRKSCGPCRAGGGSEGRARRGLEKVRFDAGGIPSVGRRTAEHWPASDVTSFCFGGSGNSLGGWMPGSGETAGGLKSGSRGLRVMINTARSALP
jgi:hypothetical protein